MSSNSSKRNKLPNKKPSQQPTLFSFFTRNPPPKSSAKAAARSNAAKPAATSCPADGIASRTAAVCTPARTTHNDKNKPNSDSKSAKPRLIPASRKDKGKAQKRKEMLCKKIKVNVRVAIYWPNDNEFYPATVKKGAEPKFFLEYDDGESEWIDFREHTFRFIDNDEELNDEEEIAESEHEGEEEEEKPPNKRPRIHDSDDEEYEFEMKDASEDEDVDEVDNDDDDDDEEQWLVFDDGDTDDRKSRTSTKKSTKKKLKASPSSTSDATPKPTRPLGSKGSSPAGIFTPTSLINFSAFAQASPTNAPKRVTPTSSVRSSLSSIAIDSTDRNKAIPYVEKAVNPAGAHIHNHLNFIKNPRDAQGRSKDEPGYDARTLKVDENELKKHNNGKPWSPGVKQWWETKAQYFDTVLLFKTGKFYEMFGMDADVGVQVCGLQYMKGAVAHAGCKFFLSSLYLCV